MSRALVPALQSVIRAIRAARRGGPTAIERLEARREAGPSRRRVLGSLVALGACSPGSGSVLPPVVSGAPRVVVLGGGLAGLTCCHRLAQAGIRADVYEARDRVGGRVTTGRGLFPAVPDLTTELGGEWVNSADAELLRLVDELGLALHDSWEEFDLETLVWLDGRRVKLRALVPDLDRLTAACDADVAALTDGGAAISYANPSGAEALDRISAADWLAGVDVGADARALIGLVTLADYGRELDDQSALNVVSLFESGADELYDERYRSLGATTRSRPALRACMRTVCRWEWRSWR